MPNESSIERDPLVISYRRALRWNAVAGTLFALGMCVVRVGLELDAGLLGVLCGVGLAVLGFLAHRVPLYSALLVTPRHEGVLVERDGELLLETERGPVWIRGPWLERMLALGPRAWRARLMGPTHWAVVVGRLSETAAPPMLQKTDGYRASSTMPVIEGTPGAPVWILV